MHSNSLSLLLLTVSSLLELSELGVAHDMEVFSAPDIGVDVSGSDTTCSVIAIPFGLCHGRRAYYMGI